MISLEWRIVMNSESVYSMENSDDQFRVWRIVMISMENSDDQFRVWRIVMISLEYGE